MKIGIIGSVAQPITDIASGGTEVFCAILAKGLKQLGHEIYLFAAKDSQLEGIDVISTNNLSMIQLKDQFARKFGREITSDEESKLYDCLNLRTVLKAKELDGKLDIFHDNTSSYVIESFSDLFTSPIVTTLHMPVTDDMSQYIDFPRLVSSPKIIYIAVSNYQKKQRPSIPYQIYNGIEIKNFKFNEYPKDHLIWISRVSPKTPKGLKEAIIITKRMKKKLVFSCTLADKEYYQEEIIPLIDTTITRVVANESLKAKSEFYGNAKALLFPVQWEEPFGFIFPEAMACGTPVIAFARGSVPEIIRDGETGFIVNSTDQDIRGDWIIKKTGIDGLCEAVERIYNMPDEQYKQMRQNCRKHVEKHFTVERMVDDYVKVYQQILNLH